MKPRRVAGVFLVLALGGRNTGAQFIGPGLRISAALGISAPVGDLDRRGGTGFGASFRTEYPIGSEDWALRGDFSFDRFAGKAGVDSYQFFTVATNIVHKSNPKLYEFGGFGIYTAKTAFGPGDSSAESAFGFQGGVGYNLSRTGLRTFVEFGITDVLTTGRSSVWFPVRFGIRI